MKDNITRRDFLNGTQVAIGGSFFMPEVLIEKDSETNPWKYIHG